MLEIEDMEEKQYDTDDLEQENFSYYASFKEAAEISIVAASFGTISVFNNFLTLAIIANINEHHLAASALIDSIQALAIAPTLSAISTVGTIISGEIVIKGNEEADEVLKSSLIAGCILSIPAILIQVLSCNILFVTGQPSKTIEILSKYFIASAAGTLPCILIYGESLAVIGLEKHLSPIILGLIRVVLTNTLGYVLNKRFGVTGIGIGFTVAQFSVFGGYSLYLKYSNEFQEYGLFRKLTPINREYLSSILQLGLPLMLTELAELSGIMINSIIIGTMTGNTGLSAHAIVFRYLVIILVPIINIGRACSILVRKSFADNTIYKADKLANSFLIIGSAVAFGTFATLAFIPEIASSIFMQKNNSNYFNIITAVRKLFFITSVTQAFDAIRLISLGALQGGYNDTKYAMVVDIICLEFIGVPLGYLLGKHTHLEVSGIYLGRSMGIFLSSMFLLNKWKSEIAIDLEKELKAHLAFSEQEFRFNEGIHFKYSNENKPNVDFSETNQEPNQSNRLCKCTIM